MKFEKITDMKIKIFFDIKDIKSQHISKDFVFYNSASSQKFLQNILAMAEKEIGFVTNDAELLIETLMPSEQEYIFTITKLSSENMLEEKNKDSFIFAFKNFDNFIELCTFLNNLSDLNSKDFSKDFSLILYNNTYYLCQTNFENFTILLDYMKEIFSEFGTKITNSFYTEIFLNEYGKKIFETNAIVNSIFHFI